MGEIVKWQIAIPQGRIKMKLLSILFNIASLCSLAYLIIEKGMPRSDEYPIVIIFAGAAILSLIVIITAKDSSYIGLWLQRKKLEEQNKIDQLNKTKP